jgi:hypothetical protein
MRKRPVKVSDTIRVVLLVDTRADSPESIEPFAGEGDGGVKLCRVSIKVVKTGGINLSIGYKSPKAFAAVVVFLRVTTRDEIIAVACSADST